LLDGYKCPSWLTLIGTRLLEKLGRPPELEALRPYQTTTSEGLLFRAREAPELIDRNYVEPFGVERASSRALAPLQIKEHAAFGGTWWTDDNTLAWPRRFS
jgi:hypothetical protein